MHVYIYACTHLFIYGSEIPTNLIHNGEGYWDAAVEEKWYLRLLGTDMSVLVLSTSFCVG